MTAAETRAPVTDPSPGQGPVTPLLRRLNRRGFRMVMLLDGLAVFGLSVLSMVVRNGAPPWPTYPLSAYLLSFSVSTLIFVVAFYFGGLYEREPRLGGAAVLPRAARLSLAAGSFVALLNLALGGVLRQRGSSIARALPFPIPNLIAVIVLAGVAVAINRAVAHALRTEKPLVDLRLFKNRRLTIATVSSSSPLGPTQVSASPARPSGWPSRRWMK